MTKLEDLKRGDQIILDCFGATYHVEFVETSKYLNAPAVRGFYKDKDGQWVEYNKQTDGKEGRCLGLFPNPTNIQKP